MWGISLQASPESAPQGVFVVITVVREWALEVRMPSFPQKEEVEGHGCEDSSGVRAMFGDTCHVRTCCFGCLRLAHKAQGNWTAQANPGPRLGVQ